MSIWMLLIFAVCMLTAVLGFGGRGPWADVAQPIFAATLAAFVLGLLTRGIRRPVD